MIRRPGRIVFAAALVAASLGAAPLLAGDVCQLPPDVGPCDGVCPRWFFNPETGECELFDWGCCEGNANNFESLEACEKACDGSIPCPADVDDDGAVGVTDLIEVILHWGDLVGPADVNRDGIVNVMDLVELLLAWGSCRT